MISQSFEKKILKLPLFSALTKEEVPLVLRALHPVVFQKDEHILHQWSKSDGLYLIEKGCVAITVRLPGDVYEPITTLTELDTFGEVALLEGGPAAANVTALKKTCCYFLSAEYFSALKVMYPQIAYKIALAIARTTCRRLQIVNTRVGGNLSDIKQETMRKLKKTPFLEPFKFEEKDLIFLHSMPLFHQFSLLEVKRILTYLDSYHYPKNSFIFEEGMASDACYFILQGAIQIALREGTHYSKLTTLGPSALFGHLSLIDKTPRFAFSYAREPSIILVAKVPRIKLFLKNERLLYYKCFIAICADLVALQRGADKLLLRLAVESHGERL